MNVYEKLQKCRIALQKMNIKKSGRNEFSKYDYFELQDFLPHINELFDEHKLFSQISFTNEFATLTIINSENPDETIVFTSPMASASLKGMHDIQNGGAVQSYQRRYLYLNALEICENDTLDATAGKEKAVQETINRANQNVSQNHRINISEEDLPFGTEETKILSVKQLNMIKGKLNGLMQKHNTSREKLLQKANITKEIEHLTPQEASKFIDQLFSWEKA